MLFRQLSVRRPIGRVGFLAWGLSLFAVKYSIDAWVASSRFGRRWTPWDYLITSLPLSFATVQPEDVALFRTLLFIAIPFILIGGVLTLRRLRDAGLPPWLVVQFFLPIINLFFFLLLIGLPRKRSSPADALVVSPTGSSAEATTWPIATPPPSVADAGPREQEPPVFQNKLTNDAQGPLPNLSPVPYAEEVPIRADEITYSRRQAAPAPGWMPLGQGASLLVASVLPVPLSLSMVWLGTHYLADYGWGVFVAMPFVQGFVAALLHGSRVRRSTGQCLAAGFYCVGLSLAATLVVALDGLGCLIMLWPLATPIALVGALVGSMLQGGVAVDQRFRSGGMLVLALPLFMVAEHFGQGEAPVYAATTAVEIDAPPEAVWPCVVSFHEMPPPTEWPFKLGVAYPVKATIEGHGVGAVRHCQFSTGPFVEPITVWDENRLLKFDVTSNPPAMREWSPYAIAPPHVKDFLVSHGGQFKLVPIDGGRRTRLEGTTWYQHHLWPADYWTLWSDFLIRTIHRRVLNQVKAEAEGGVAMR